MSASAQDTSVLRNIFSGYAEALPERKSRTIKVFISSTFTDMEQERNKLMTDAYPELKRYCRERHACEFQVVDMRWGVQSSASEDHSTSESCLKQIRACQRDSYGPTFICFLGDRYGTKFCRPIIPRRHWEALTKHLTAEADRSLLELWYQLDKNALDEEFVLQPLAVMNVSRSQWNEISVKLIELLKRLAYFAHLAGEFDEEELRQYTYSVTEEEIQHGLLSNSNSAHQCLAFFRTFKNINPSHPKLWRFMDITPDGSIDADAEKLLIDLKKRVKACIPNENTKEYEISWSDDEGVNITQHSEYLQNISEDVIAQVKRLIDYKAGLVTMAAQVVENHAGAREVAGHLWLCLDKCSQLVSRMDIMKNIHAYITGQGCSQPLIIHGVSGVGKTSIMADAALQCRKWLADSPAAVVIRFLGTSPKSSDIRSVLFGLCEQMTFISGRSLAVSQSVTFNELLTEFHTLLKTWSDSTQLVIFLDSIDQLKPCDEAYNLKWLPSKLKDNVRFIISTLPDHHNILEKAIARRFDPTNYVAVSHLTSDDSSKIISLWLTNRRRQLTDEQTKVLNEAICSRPCRPLYLKLVFDLIARWRSYTHPAALPPDITECIRHLFTRLENQHGQKQTQLALTYVTACPFGISQAELEDVLSLDDDYLTEVYQFHVPPIRRIPPMLWARLQEDLEGYIVERESDEVAVMSWYHRQFIENAFKIYVDSADLNHIYKTLEEYFSGKWFQTAKPFTYSEKMRQKLELDSPNSMAQRYVPSQPTAFARNRFNARKIHILSHLWTQTGVSPVECVIKSYPFNTEFLVGRLTLDSWHEIEAELKSMCNRAISEGSQSEEVRVQLHYLLGTLRMHHLTLCTLPGTACSQLMASLLHLHGRVPRDCDLFTPLLDDIIDGTGLNHSALVPVKKMLDAPGGMLLLSQQHLTSPYAIQIVKDKGRTLVITASINLLVLHMESMQLLLNIKLISGSGGNSKVSVQAVVTERDVFILCSTYAGVFLVVSLAEHEIIRRVTTSKISGNIIPVVDRTRLGVSSLFVAFYDEESFGILSVDSGRIIWRLKQNYVNSVLVLDMEEGNEKRFIANYAGLSAHYRVMLSGRTVQAELLVMLSLPVATITSRDCFILPPEHRGVTRAILKYGDVIVVNQDQQCTQWTSFSCLRSLQIKTAGCLNTGTEVAIFTGSAYDHRKPAEDRMEVFSLPAMRRLGSISSVMINLVEIIVGTDRLAVTSGHKVLIISIAEVDQRVQFTKLLSFYATAENGFLFVKGLENGFLFTGSIDNQVKFWSLDRRNMAVLHGRMDKTEINMNMLMSPRGHLAFSFGGDNTESDSAVFDASTGWSKGVLPNTNALDLFQWMDGNDPQFLYLACMLRSFVIWKIYLDDRPPEKVDESPILVMDKGIFRRIRVAAGKTKCAVLLTYNGSLLSKLVIYDSRTNQFSDAQELLFHGRSNTEIQYNVKAQFMTDTRFFILVFEIDDFTMITYDINGLKLQEVNSLQLPGENLLYEQCTYLYLRAADKLIVQDGQTVLVQDCQTFHKLEYPALLSYRLLDSVVAQHAVRHVFYVEIWQSTSQTHKMLVRYDLDRAHEWGLANGYDVIMSNVPPGIMFKLSPDLKYLALVNEDFIDRCIRVYRMRDMQEIGSILPPGPKWGHRCEFSGDSRYLCINLRTGEFVSWLIVDPQEGDYKQTAQLIPCRRAIPQAAGMSRADDLDVLSVMKSFYSYEVRGESKSLVPQDTGQPLPSHHADDKPFVDSHIEGNNLAKMIQSSSSARSSLPDVQYSDSEEEDVDPLEGTDEMDATITSQNELFSHSLMTNTTPSPPSIPKEHLSINHHSTDQIVASVADRTPNHSHSITDVVSNSVESIRNLAADPNLNTTARDNSVELLTSKSAETVEIMSGTGTLYIDLPYAERSKKIEKLVEDLQKQYTTVCAII